VTIGMPFRSNEDGLHERAENPRNARTRHGEPSRGPASGRKAHLDLPLLLVELFERLVLELLHHVLRAGGVKRLDGAPQGKESVFRGEGLSGGSWGEDVSS